MDVVNNNNNALVIKSEAHDCDAESDLTVTTSTAIGSSSLKQESPVSGSSTTEVLKVQ
jgi:hypothetical protein